MPTIQRSILSLIIFLTACAGNQQLPPANSAPQPAAQIANTGDDTNASTTSNSNDVTPQLPQPISLEPAFGGVTFDRPTELGPYPGDRVFIAEQDGRVMLLNHDGSDIQPLMDIQPQVSRRGNEEGLLSVALDPAFSENGHLWAYYSVASGQRRTRLARFTVTDDVADLSSELVILEQEQPFSNHNGGAIRFGPDMMLYLSIGDGGSGGDPQNHGQNVDTLLGTIIRIDVRNASAAQPYVVPTDNPFVNGGGQPEIWAYGLRNVWRMAFDSVNGNLWAGDVGQNAFEEIDIIEKGGNYGWNTLEGDRCFKPAQDCNGTDTIAPIVVYGRDSGCSVTGGVVYQGDAVSEITNAYVYGDFCTGTVWAINAEAPSEPVAVAEGAGQISSFGFGADGDVYLLRFNGSPLRLVSP